MTTKRDLDVTPISGTLGAEVRGIDLARVDNELVGTVRDLLHENLVVLFPQQHLSVDAH